MWSVFIMIRNISCTINDKAVTLTVDVRQSLIEVLRENGYTSVKEGCGVGECGACTVLMDGKTVNSCLVFIGQVGGHTIETIEGLVVNDSLHPLQTAFIEAGAVQCGYCTPGMIITATALLDRNPNPSREEIIEAMDDNICRCGSYLNIIEAILAFTNGPST